MEETPIFDLPYPEETDPPDGAAQIQAAVEKVEDLLTEIEGLILGAPAAGNLIIVNGTNDPVYKAATGDVTNNSAGMFSIGEEKVATTMVKNLAITAAKIAEEAVETAKIKNLHVTEGKLGALAVSAAKIAAEAIETGKIKGLAVTEAKIAAAAVTEAKIADGAVTSRKAKLTAGIKECTEDTVLEGAYKDIVGAKLEITPAVASILKVTAIFDFEITASELNSSQGNINLDGATQAAFANGTFGTTAGTRYQAVQVYALALTAAAHTIKQVAKRQSGATKVKATHTRFLYELIAS